MDCLIYGQLLDETPNIDPDLPHLEQIFKAYLTVKAPFVRERIVRKLFQRIKVAQSVNLHSK